MTAGGMLPGNSYWATLSVIYSCGTAWLISVIMFLDALSVLVESEADISVKGRLLTSAKSHPCFVRHR